jgi:hypothetical protein
VKNRVLLILLCLISIGFTSCKSSKRGTKNRSNSHQKAEYTPTQSNRLIQKKYASILSVPEGEIRNIALYEFIDEWTGTPYKYGGCSKSGADCSGFTGALYSEVYKRTIPRTTSDIEKQTKAVDKSNLREGDMVIFDIEGKKSSHVGVYLLNGRFVHASSSKGVIISTLDSPYYQKHFYRGGRF